MSNKRLCVQLPVGKNSLVDVIERGIRMKEPPNPEGVSDSDLAGKTLQVYWYMLKHREALSLRDIQRGAGISSASLAAYHLRKLQGLGLVETSQDGDYVVRQEVQVGVTRFYVNIRRTMVPRFALYASFYLAIVALSVLLLPGAPPYLMILLAAVALFGVLTSVFEAITLSRIAPS